MYIWWENNSLQTEHVQGRIYCIQYVNQNIIWCGSGHSTKEPYFFGTKYADPTTVDCLFCRVFESICSCFPLI